MQGRISQFISDESMISPAELVAVHETDTASATTTTTTTTTALDDCDMAELAAGYIDCMEEAIRYLVEVELYPESHPAVEGLRQHLAAYQQQLFKEVLYQTQRPAPGS